MEEEKKYIYNDKAERIKKMNRFYIGATIFLGILFLLYLWLRMANQNLVNATVYGNTVLIIGASVLNTIIYQRDNSNEYHKRANFPENIEFSGISLYSDKSIRHHKNTRNFNGN